MKRLREPPHANSHPTTSANNSKPHISRIKSIEEQLDDMLRSGNGGYKPNKRVAGGVEGTLTYTIKMMSRLINVVAKQRKELRRGRGQASCKVVADYMQVGTSNL